MSLSPYLIALMRHRKSRVSPFFRTLIKAA